MNLHEDIEAFKELVEATASEFNLLPFQVEKDYYVSYFLKKLREVAPGIVFKGGTSLSKCYSIIDRFSEDIDLTIYFEKDRLTNGEITKSQIPLIEAIKQTIQELNLTLLNDGTIFPRLKFNKYEVEYTRIYTGEGITQMLDHILVETTLTYKPYPCDTMYVSNYITKFLEKEQPELIAEYQLQPFRMNIQTVERTFIDKIFALCDYHHDEDYKGKSRHIYDIHKIYRSGLLNEDILPDLVIQIIETRRAGHKTHSCQEGYEPIKVLQEIINGLVYFNDYETNTREFLSVYVEYDTAIASLQEILTRDWIPHLIPVAPETATR